MSNWNDFNDAPQQPSFDLIPRNTAAKLRLTIKPGGFDDPAQGWAGGWATQSFETGAISRNPALFAAINKDTQELWFELVPFDAALAQKMSDRAVRVIQATEAGELLPRAFAEASHFECKFCSYAQRCWGGV